MNEWMNEWMYKWMDGWMVVEMYGHNYRIMDGLRFW